MNPKAQNSFQEKPDRGSEDCWFGNLHRELTDQNRLKKLPTSSLVPLSNNDYLGLSQHPEIISASANAVYKFGTGATGSRFLSGNHPLNSALEGKIALFKTSKNVQGIVFSSGYHANISIMTVLGGYSTAIYSDSENHASLIDGLRLVKIPAYIYPHNDWEWVRKHMAQHPTRRPMIVTESVFSMSGDLAPVIELYRLAQIFGGILVIDDAHGTGTIGATGRGILEASNIEFDARHMIITGTFSKALGSFGGFALLGNKEKEVIQSLARPFIYSTGLPPATLSASLAALNILTINPQLVQKLQEMSIFWNRSLINKKSSLPIISIEGKSDQLFAWSRSLEKLGLSLPILKYPTVPHGSDRLRLSVNLGWTQSTISALNDTFKTGSPCP
jgi:7-keto-8-aminopelargonate synthetase-like enzyme